MTNTEALERLIGSSILSVKLVGGESDPYGVEITTTDGETIVFMVTMYEEISVGVKNE